MKQHLSLAFTILAPVLVNAQFELTFDQSIPVTRDGNTLEMAWAGGLNFPQVSDIDLNGDGVKDLFFFDRSGNSSLILLNDGVADQSSYHYTHEYNTVYPFPDLTEWVLLRDYNCDGKEDIFTYTLGGFKVYKNTSVGGNLSFVEVDTLVRSNYVPTDANLYVTQVDIPGIEDIDGDGDLDVITYSIFGNYVEYHKNLSMELYGTCDSLNFEVANRCWGFFAQSLSSTHNTLNSPCTFNVPNPEVTVQIEKMMTQLRADPHPTVNDDAGRAHSGSTSLPLDLDGDGDKDLLTGGVQYDNLIALYNGGALDSAYMTAQDTLFPSYDAPVQVDIFPAAFFEDVNNDAKRDLVVMPNYPSLSENYHSVWYYNNHGTDAAPIFHFMQNDLFQNRMIDVGEGAYPVTFDYNGDGLMDLIVADYGYYHVSGTYPCMLAVLQNTGTLAQPAFAFVDSDYVHLSTSGIGAAMYPAFGDLDGDGDKDLYIGDQQGKLHYYENMATGPAADFQLTDPSVVNDLGALIDVGQSATPQFFDVDGDNKLDMLIGERNGNINYYHNTGTVNAPTWHLESDSVGGVVVAEWWNITGYSVPFMFINDLGQRELVVGSESGALYQYDGIDGNVDGTWNQVDSTWQDLREGGRTGLTLYDFNNDGQKDAVIGNYRGGLSYWRNDYGLSTNDPAMLNSAQAFTLMPNPTADGADVLLNMPVGKDMRVNVLNGLGQVVFTSALHDKRFHMETRGLGHGVYTVMISDGVRRWAQRLVVLH